MPLNDLISNRQRGESLFVNIINSLDNISEEDQKTTQSRNVMELYGLDDPEIINASDDARVDLIKNKIKFTITKAIHPDKNPNKSDLATKLFQIFTNTKMYAENYRPTSHIPIYVPPVSSMSPEESYYSSGPTFFVPMPQVFYSETLSPFENLKNFDFFCSIYGSQSADMFGDTNKLNAEWKKWLSHFSEFYQEIQELHGVELYGIILKNILNKFAQLGNFTDITLLEKIADPVIFNKLTNSKEFFSACANVPNFSYFSDFSEPNQRQTAWNNKFIAVKKRMADLIATNNQDEIVEYLKILIGIGHLFNNNSYAEEAWNYLEDLIKNIINTCSFQKMKLFIIGLSYSENTRNLLLQKLFEADPQFYVANFEALFKKLHEDDNGKPKLIKYPDLPYFNPSQLTFLFQKLKMQLFDKDYLFYVILYESKNFLVLWELLTKEEQNYHLAKRDKNGDTLLHRAVAGSYEKIAEKLGNSSLVSRFAGLINTQNKQGETPLDIALQNSAVKKPEVDALIKCGADLSKYSDEFLIEKTTSLEKSKRLAIIKAIKEAKNEPFDPEIFQTAKK